jgi:modification methylase
VLKKSGTLWVIGSYHNIFRIGAILQDLGFWILNDVIWLKTNPMPNFRGVRFTNAHETLIWVSKSKGSKYTFNHHAMKAFNRGKQLRSDWILPICTGDQRLKVNGEKAHSTQKPEGLLYRVILSSTNPGDIVLDPFFGSGTTGAVAKILHRNWIGIEQNKNYVKIAKRRIDQIKPKSFDQDTFDVRDKKRLAPRVAFASLLEVGLLSPGQHLYFQNKNGTKATIKPDGKLIVKNLEGSIHQLAKSILDGSPGNGWDLWLYQDTDGEYYPIDKLRQIIRDQL